MKNTYLNGPRQAKAYSVGTQILTFTLTAVFCLLAVLLLAGCGSSTGNSSTPAYVSPYNWSNLQYSGDRMAYLEGGKSTSLQGIDVSTNQGAIDWQAVSADNIDFAIVRLGNRGYTEGGLFLDDRYTQNMDGATAAGLDTGVYFFSQAINPEEALEEADFVLKHLNSRKLTMPVVFDHEPVTSSDGRANNIAGAELAAITRAFCERIEAAGYDTMVYGNKYDIARFGNNPAEASAAFGNRPVWFAEYEAKVPSGQFDFVMWQYSNAGRVSGINAAVDMNILFLPIG